MKAIDAIRKAIRVNKCCITVRPCCICDYPSMLFITSDEQLYLSTNCECIDHHFSALQKKPLEFLQQLIDEGENKNARG